MATPDYFTRQPSYNKVRSGGGGGGSLTPGAAATGAAAAAAGQPPPRTPTLGRTFSSQYGSPGGSYRVEEESLIYSIGARSLHAGFAGESAPRCIQTFGPEDGRRVDDFRRWTPGASKSLYRHPGLWGKDWELWSRDVRDVDLGLVEDKIERAIRDAHTKYLLLDQRSRRAVLALPSCLSNPLLDTVLTTIFTSSSPSTISIWVNPLLNTISAGLRSALVLDIGWDECVVTAVYEYREVLHRRSVRAAKRLTQSMASMLEEHTGPRGAREKVTFETGEDIVETMAWCRKSKDAENPEHDDTVMAIPIKTLSGLSTNLKVAFSSLAEPVEKTFFENDTSPELTDDHVLPLHVLAYRCLLALPLDVRAICMSRIVITGGVSNVPGLKSRLLREIEQLVKTKRWDPVVNYGSATEARKKARQSQGTSMPVRVKPPDESETFGQAQQVPARDLYDKDDISEKLAREAAKRGEPIKGVVRGVETLGPWAGASLLSGLKIDGVLEVRRDDYLKHGLASLGPRLDAI